MEGPPQLLASLRDLAATLAYRRNGTDRRERSALDLEGCNLVNQLPTSIHRKRWGRLEWMSFGVNDPCEVATLLTNDIFSYLKVEQGLHSSRLMCLGSSKVRYL